MHGHLLGLPVRAVRRLLVFHTRQSDRVRRLLPCILPGGLRREQQQN